MKRKILTTITASVMTSVILSGCVVTTVEPEIENKTPDIFDVSSIRAADDFYGYVNAEYLLNLEVNQNTGGAGSFEMAYDLVDEQLNTVIRDIANGDRDSYLPGSNEQIIYDFYWQLYDYTTANVDAGDVISDSIIEVVNQIDSVATYEEFFDRLSDVATTYGTPLMLQADVSINNTNSSENVLYIYPETAGRYVDFKDISQGLSSANYLKESIKTTLYYSGVDYEEADSRATDLTYLFIGLAGQTNFDVFNFDLMNEIIEEISEDEIDDTLVNMTASDIYKIFGVEENPLGVMKVLDMNQLIYFDSLMTEENLRAFKDMAICNFINSYSRILPENMGGSFVVYSDDTGAVEAVKSYIPEQLGEIYAERYQNPEVVNAVVSITEDLVDEYMVLISGCEWMDESTKEAIIDKLNSMSFYIGAGEAHEINPEDSSLIGDNLFETLTNLTRVTWSSSVASLTESVDRNGFSNMAPQTVNACYNPSLNCINITLGIMNAPFFDINSSYAANLGGIGCVVGHEISHAFDSNGMKYDADGNYNPDWICEDDRNDFAELSDSFAAYYSNFVVMDVYHVDGVKTLGENMADASALQCALNIVTDDLGRRELFEAYARIWASVTADQDAVELLEMDEHSPDRVRVNAVVSMFDCFYELYDVNPGDAMYIAPEDRVIRW